MPITLTVDHERQESHATAIGDITMADIRSHISDVLEQKSFSYPELIDGTRATANFDSEDMRETARLIEVLSKKGPIGPTAIIVPNDFIYGMFRMLGILLGGICELQTFRSTQREEAESWLAQRHISSLNDRK